MTRPRPPRASLALTITLALIVKVLILSLLWKAFFSAPPTKKMRLPTSVVEQHLLSPPAPIPTLPSKAHDDSH
ncbi:cytochrome oxidase putative small subunit CydP [Janthinobacterium sp.]|uniref:cytochrome oxidase putative small subunit CydP n=1 Tax=Janthinobacterium sp. TaxID=1871054 RepID=UPI00293D29BD|nr:cytochrome oxidase putative small subunit CydP [Janthinobacterium sp.]